MAMDVATLTVKVESKGVDNTTKALQGLEKQADNTSKSVDALMTKMLASSGSMQAIVAAMSQIRAQMVGVMPTGAITSATGALKEMLDELKKVQSAMNLGGGKTMAITYKEIGDNSKEAVKGVESLNQSLAKGQNVFQAVGKELYHIRNLLGGTMLAGAITNSIQGIITLADSWTLMNAKLKVFIGTAEMASLYQEKLYRSAQDLKVPLEGVTTLFTRLVPAMAEYGYNAESALAVTESMAAALKVSGATTAEVSSVMLQFSQAMAAGRLNGAEFNAIAEGAPIVLRLLSKELGVSRGQLKAMAADGLLSATVIAETMKKHKDSLIGMSKELPLTVSASFSALTNAFTRFIGELNSGRGVTGALADSIKFLADNLDNLVSVVKYAVIGFGTLYTGLVAYNTITAIAIARSTALAIEVGLVGRAAMASSVSFGFLGTALNFIAKHPILITLSLLVTAGVAIYEAFYKAGNGVEEYQKKFEELDLAGDKVGALKALENATNEAAFAHGHAAVALDEMRSKYNRLTKAQQEFANSFGGFGTSLDAIKKQEQEVARLAKAWNKSEQAVKDYLKASAEEKIAAETKSIDEKIKLLEKEISMKRKMSDTEEKLFKLRDQRSSLVAEGKGTKVLLDNLNQQEASLERLNGVEQRHKLALEGSKKATSEQESAAKKLANAYAKAVESAKEFLTKQEEELGLKRKLTDAEREVLKIRSDIEGKFKGKDTGELRSLAEKIKLQGEQVIVQQKLNESMEDYFKKLTQTMEAEDSFAEASFKSAEAQRQKLSAIQRQINGATQTPLGDALESSEADQRRIDFINKQISATQKLIEETLTLEYTKAISSGDTKQQERIWALMEVRQKYIDNLKLEKLSIEDNTKSLDKYHEELFKLSKITMSEMGRSPGQILADGFGEAGNAISGMISAYQDFGKESKKINEELAAQQKYLMSKGASGDELARVEQAAADKRMQINAQMFGSMAKTAKGFFGEQSNAYKNLEKVERAFRAVELALAIKSSVAQIAASDSVTIAELQNSAKRVAALFAEGAQAAATAVASALAAGPMGWVALGGIVATLAAVGFAVSGGGGVGAGNVSSERQASSGTGTVLGDSGAKSESVGKTLEIIAENSSIALRYNEGMLTSLKNIEASLVGLSKVVIRSGVQKQVGGVEGMGRQAGFDMVFGGNSNAMDKLLTSTGVLAFVPQLTKAFFSVKKSVVDSGILQVAESFKDIATGGADLFGFAAIETKTKKWGKTKTSVEENLSELDKTLKDQFTLTIRGMGNAITEAAKALGVNGNDFTARLDNFVVDIGRISLQGLTSEQIQEQFAAVFSKLGDEMALAAIPGLDNFQEVGEGYLETLIRVASTVATVDGIFNELGSTFGLVGDGSYAAKLALVDLAGGLSELQSVASAFYEAFTTDEDKLSNQVRLIKQGFADLGITVEEGQITAETARADFKRFFDEVANSGTATQEMLLGLMQIGLMVDKIAPSFEDLKTKAEEAVDPIKTLKDTLAGLKTAASTALSDLERSVAAEKTSAKKEFDERMKGLKKQRDVLVESQRIERTNLENHLNTLEDQRVAGVQAQITANETYLDSVRSVRDNLKTLFDDIDSAIKTLTNSQTTLQSSTYQLAKSQLDSALATARMSGSLPDADKFKDVLATITGIGSEAFSSSFQMQREKLVSAGKLAELRSITGGQLGQKDAQVQLLEQQLSVLNNMTARNDAGIKATLELMDKQHAEDLAVIDEEIRKAEEEYNNYIGRLDGILQTAKDALAIADGTYRVLLSVDSAITNFGTALAGYVAYQDQQKALLQSQVDMVSMKNSSLQLTVEQVNAGAEALAAEVRQMKEELKAGNLAIASNTLQTAKVLSQWDGDGQPEVRNVA